MAFQMKDVYCCQCDVLLSMQLLPKISHQKRLAQKLVLLLGLRLCQHYKQVPLFCGLTET